MTVQGVSWQWDGVFGGSDGYTATHQYNFAPTNALAQTSLSVGSPGLGVIGFSQFTSRPDPAGPDQVINLPPFTLSDGALVAYPPLAYDPAMTSVTWLLICGGGDDQMAGSILLFSLG
jgi:hypothetical protein